MHPLGYLVHSLFAFKLQCPADTVLHAGGVQTGLCATGAKRALSSDIFLRVEIHRSMGAGGDTESAPGTNLFINQDNTVRPPLNGLDRADPGTCGIFTLDADSGNHGQMEIIVNVSGTDGYDPAPPGPQREAMFLFTSDFACIATHTLVNIDQQQFFRHALLHFESCTAGNVTGCFQSWAHSFHHP